MINKVNLINTQVENSKKNTSFKGATTLMLGSLDWMKNNPALSACGVDLCSMVIPRTVVEAKDRGKQSGIETFIREISSATIHAVMGFIGLGSAILLSDKFNKENGIKAQNIFASGDTIKNLSEIWKLSDHKTTEFYKNFLDNIKGLNTQQWKGISENVKNELALDLEKLSCDTQNLEILKGDEKTQLKEELKELRKSIITKITKDTGARGIFKINGLNGAKEITLGLNDIVDNVVSLSNAFKVQAEKFGMQSQEKFPEFIEKLMKNKSNSTLLGLGITSMMCMSIQPINRMLTKKRTGNDGFVGVDTKENDNSLGFKVMKTIAGIGFPMFAISTIPGKLKDLLSNVQFNGKVPTINQFKFVYGLTIGSRLLASRDGNELRESLIKDSLGFCTWLLFGDFVSKLITRYTAGKDFINNPIVKDTNKSNFSYAKDWLMKSSVKSYDEILVSNAAEPIKDGKVKKLKELFENSSPDLKKKVLKVAGAQVAGYLFSGIVLGWGIAKLNIFITKHLHAKDKADKQMNKEINKTEIQQKTNTVYLMETAKNSSSVFNNFK